MNDTSTIPVNDQEMMLTTIDNPYNPFTQWIEWYAFDQQMGYNTCSLLARVTISSDDLSEKDQQIAIQAAIGEILDLNITGKYIAVTKANANTIINRRK